MMMKRVVFLMLLTGVLFACKGDDWLCCANPFNCDKNVVVDEIKYNETSTANYGVDSVVLNGHCLEITITSGGCDPNNWDMNLFASELIVETNPAQYKTKIELINNEDCLAVFQKTMSFDVTSLQMTGTNQVQIDIEGWNTPILYQY